MQKERIFHYSLATGWFVTSLAAALVSTILIPEESRSSHFWYRVCWAEFLIFLFWGSTGFYIYATGRVRDQVTRLGGIAPTISIVTGIYAVLSLAVMMIHASVSETDAGNRIHLTTQVLFFSGAALSAVFLSIARGGTVRVGFGKTKAMSPIELHDLLAPYEMALSSDSESSRMLKDCIKQLRELLRYSLHESDHLDTVKDYQTLCGEIKNLCNSFDRILKEPFDKECAYLEISNSAKRIAANVKKVAQMQIVK